MSRKLWALRSISETEAGDASNVLNILSFKSAITRNEITALGIEPSTLINTFTASKVIYTATDPFSLVAYIATIVSGTNFIVCKLDLTSGSLIKVLDLSFTNEILSGIEVINTSIFVLTQGINRKLREYSTINYALLSILPLDDDLQSLSYDGVNLWTIHPIAQVFERRDVNNFLNRIELFAYDSTIFDSSPTNLMYDSRTGYLWIKGVHSNIPKVLIWDSVTKSNIEVFELGKTGEVNRFYYARHQWIADKYGSSGPELVTFLLPGAIEGLIPIRYILTDFDGVRFNMIAHEFSIDNGITWKPATAGPGGDGEVNLLASAAGIQHSWIWNSLADIGYTDQAVKIRLAFQSV